MLTGSPIRPSGPNVALAPTPSNGLLSTVEDARLTEAMQQRECCEDACDALSAILSHSTAIEPLLLQSAQTALLRMRRSLHALHDCLLDNNAAALFPESSRATEVCQKVFGTAELLEHILSYLSTTDLLSMRQVSKAVSADIETSHTLQCKLGQKGDDKASVHFPSESQGIKRSSIRYHLRLLPRVLATRNTQSNAGTSGSSPCTRDEFELESGRVAELRVVVTPDDQGKLPVIGLRYRTMLLCQPPAKTLVLKPECCSYRRRSADSKVASGSNLVTLTSSTGITLGALWDAAAVIIAQHRLCPYAPDFLHDKDGNVRVMVSGTGQLRLRLSDPFVVAAAQPRLISNAKEGIRWTGLISTYIQAKREAKMAGETIPTLEVFEKTYDEPVIEDVVLNPTL